MRCPNRILALSSMAALLLGACAQPSATDGHGDSSARSLPEGGPAAEAPAGPAPEGEPEPAPPPDLSSPEACARFVFATLVENDHDGFARHAVGTKEQYLSWIAGLEMHDERRSGLQAEFERQFERNRDEVLASWKDVRAKAEADGVVWADAEIDKMLVSGGNEEEASMGWHERRIKVFFKEGGNRYHLQVDDCLDMGDAWRTHDELRWWTRNR